MFCYNLYNSFMFLLQKSKNVCFVLVFAMGSLLLPHEGNSQYMAVRKD
jgi:hypothetical protein